MKFKIIIFLFCIFSCTPNSSINLKKNYSAKGFAYIYNNSDNTEQIIKGKMNNNIMQISQQNLRIGALIKIINPKNNESLVLKIF